MKLTVDLESGSLYFIICDTEVVESEEIAPGVILDHDEKGDVVALEILDIKEKYTVEQISSIDLEMPTVVED
ncbi:MAG: DUF2283 domain-containing protein [Thermoplasmatota archaeon]